MASALGSPTSLPRSTVLCIVDRDWGRATRPTATTGMVSGDFETDLSVSLMTAITPEDVENAGAKRLETVRPSSDFRQSAAP
ncbi:hypothetical protein [Haloarchaeobius litoreus]|uniref:Uncharacterized protein n=1 Tax=Haloarchaeobius litoreus TaxID=755306 RepID=A0ABD6DKT0_9EURY|nr:hypothetical protein [Haloarchaeobius litoreus]